MLTVYGRITAGQDVSVGNYTDTVVVTLEYDFAEVLKCWVPEC